MKKLRLAVLIGSGSRLPAIYEYTKRPAAAAELSVVVSFKRESPKLAWIGSFGIPAFYHRWIEYKDDGKSKEEFNQDLVTILKSFNTEAVLGVGWDIIWTKNFLDAFPQRVLNAHPFPLPDEPVETIVYEDQVIPVLRGMDALKRAYDQKLPITGACVHFATELIDVGPVIKRVYLPIDPDSTFAELEKKHLAQESKLLVEVVDLFASGRVTLANNRVVIKDEKQTTPIFRQRKNVLVIGSGGREHALVWKLAQSKNVGKIFCAPGNAGMSEIATNVSLEVTDVVNLLKLANEEKIDLTLVGPEASLAAGVADEFTKNGLKIFGPTKAAAQIESSKVWAVEFLKRHNLPHPRSRIFDRVDEATKYIKEFNGDCVVKADGLAQGKGVIVCTNVKEARDAIKRIMINKEFGKSGDTIIIQERLVGKEVSVMAFCDGKVAIPIVSAQDHKRVFDSDEGPNTGGMGAFAPSSFLRPRLFKKITRLLSLTVEAMAEEGIPYKGILYGGLMIVDEQPYFLEYNCRFGDPETQVQLPLLETDLVEIMEACIDGKLSRESVRFKDGASVCVVLASSGYPGKYEVGKLINGLEELEGEKSVFTFHAGTTKKGSQIVTNGGRVLGITALGSTLEEARDRVYAVIGNPTKFEGMHYRKDIGRRL